jgi:hypothetical protein
MRRRRTTSSRHHIFALQLFSLFGVLMIKREKRVISISIFLSSVVCNMDKDLLYVCVPCDTLNGL